ncbi:MAG TPA: prepilin-type N-terminal cleavage/methylation domain-containing protein [Patescibacteria group bacterium]|nr:prepilin-type N-terminal cleavage/methylation domain-containing protein [Patescibacteria group bacterium]
MRFLPQKFVNSKTRRNLKFNQAGFSLMELLVAITVSLLILGSIYTVYAVSQKSYKTGSAQTDLTQNARIGLERISRELRETEEIATVLTATKDNPLVAHEISFRDSNFEKIRYIKYYLSGTDLKRQIYHYYVDSAEVWVSYDTSDAVLSSDEDTIISSNITGLTLYGTSIITIDLTATQGSQTINLQTEIKPRNLI